MQLHNDLLLIQVRQACRYAVRSNPHSASYLKDAAAVIDQSLLADDIPLEKVEQIINDIPVEELQGSAVREAIQDSLALYRAYAEDAELRGEDAKTWQTELGTALRDGIIQAIP